MCSQKSDHSRDARENQAKESRAVPARNAQSLRIEPTDHWHDGWKKVLAHVDRVGKRSKLAIDADGWLSSRQVLMVAFVGQTPEAHLGFTVVPSKTGCIRARLDSYGIEPKFCGRGIESQLHRAAIEHATTLNCEKLTGFKLNSKWC